MTGQLDMKAKGRRGTLGAVLRIRDARGTLRHKIPQLQQALHGQIESHHRVLLGQIFAHMSYLEDSIHHLKLEIDQRLSPFEEAMQLRLAHSWHSGDYRCCYSG